MNEFAAVLIESILTRLVAGRGNSRFAHTVANGIRDDVEHDPSLMPAAIEEALNKTGHALTPNPKGQL